MAVTQSTLRALRRMRIALDRQIDAPTALTAAAWSRAWHEASGALAETIDELLRLGDGDWPSRAQIRKASRAQAALTLVAEQVRDLARQTGVAVTEGAPLIAREAADLVEAVTRAQLPTGRASAGIVWDRVDEQAITAIVQRTTRQITTLTRPLSAEAESAMRSALIRGVVVGSNPRTAARDMLRRCESVFDGGRARAEVIARTEMIDAARAGAQAARESNSDVLDGWRWSTTLSARTCPACLAMNGRRFDTTQPGPLGHPQCRCVAVPITRSWAELGITGLDEPADEFPDSRAWFDQQTPAVQAQIMGQSRLAELNAGRLSWDQIPTLQTNPGWRPAYQTRPVQPLHLRPTAGTRRAA